MLRIGLSVGNHPNSPLLMNPMTQATLDMLRKRDRKQVKTDWTPMEEAETKISRDPQGRIAIPSTNLLACLVNAGRMTKHGKKQLSTADSSLVPAFVSIEEDFLVLNGNGTGAKENPPFVADQRRGCNPADGVAVCLTRPKFMHWGFECHLIVDNAEFGVDTVKKLVDNAGKYIGLGDFRPQKRGPFGRFRIVAWDEQEIEGAQWTTEEPPVLSRREASQKASDGAQSGGRKGHGS